MLYGFGVMTCDEYYRSHPDPATPDRCRLTSIQASTARSFALLAAATTTFGLVNLFYTGWAIKRWGVKMALLGSVFCSAVRLAIQNVGIQHGAGVGIIIIQCSQVITVVGGPAGYLLALNTFGAEVVAPAERTATLGRLQGCALIGTAVGYLGGGLLSDALGLIAPFRATLLLFLLSSCYIAILLPRIHPPLEKPGSSPSVFDPLRMFAPSRWRLTDGRIQKEYGIILLGLGAFMALLATGYIPVLLQMYATDVLDFGTTKNGWLVSSNSLIRGAFLTFAFPAIISRGRKWMDPGDGEESYEFDLLYCRWSILVDGVLTALASFTCREWQIFVVAAVLPLAAGTGSSARGTILQMCSPTERADALNAISLVEMAANLATVGLFGYIFSAFAAMGQPSWTFVVNGAVALAAFTILALARFPPRGSTRVDAAE
jgi:MFS family permease